MQFHLKRVSWNYGMAQRGNEKKARDGEFGFQLEERIIFRVVVAEICYTEE